jgi:tRNA A37 methylthiotransferase MiaB
VVSFFRSRVPDLQLVTDIIVGYPGESGEDFRQSCELLLRTMPDKVNISRFSPMPGTEASKLKQLDSAEVAKRSREISRLCLDIGLRVNRQYLGRRLGVLVTEEGTRGGFIGRAHNYKPVVLEGVRLGDEMEVKISGATSTYLLGTLD